MPFTWMVVTIGVCVPLLAFPKSLKLAVVVPDHPTSWLNFTHEGQKSSPKFPAGTQVERGFLPTWRGSLLQLQRLQFCF